MSVAAVCPRLSLQNGRFFPFFFPSKKEKKSCGSRVQFITIAAVQIKRNKNALVSAPRRQDL